VSQPETPNIHVPRELRAGVWANHVDVFGDFEELTLDFAVLDPRTPLQGELVARVTVSRWCILKLGQEIEGRVK
jgi:hypothetical protein